MVYTTDCSKADNLMPTLLTVFYGMMLSLWITSYMPAYFAFRMFPVCIVVLLEAASGDKGEVSCE